MECQCLQYDNAHDAWSEWKTRVLSAANDTIGHKVINGNKKAWFDSEIKESTDDRKDAYRAHRTYCKNKGNTSFDEEVGNALWDNYQGKRIACKSLIRRKIMQMRVDRCSSIMEKGGAQCKDFRTQLKGKKSNNNVTSIRIPGSNQTTSDHSLMKSSISMYFNTLGKMNCNLNDCTGNDDMFTHLNENYPDVTSENNNVLDTLTITIDDIVESISKCKNNKTPGIDSITNELIKNGGNAMNTSLLSLFTKFANLERTPDEWNKGVIIPIFKKGTPKTSTTTGVLPLTLACLKYTSESSPIQCHIFSKIITF